MNATTLCVAGITLPPPSPDFERLRRVLLRQGEPDRLPFIELTADRESMEGVLGETIPDPESQDLDLRKIGLDHTIRFWHLLGFDYVAVTTITRLPHLRLSTHDGETPALRARKWVNESEGIINSWEDFSNYPWPDPSEIDYFDLDYVSNHLPAGMKVLFRSHGGIIENATRLMGLTPFAIALKDDPGLIEAVTNKIGDFLTILFSNAVQRPEVGAVWLGDDMGFRTSTIISPEDLRRCIFPWQKKLVDTAHAYRIPFILHSCGNILQIMDALIEEVGIDARHSFEDAIQPVGEAKRLYGDRIALLGGVDIDMLCRAPEQDLRAYTRRMIDECAPGGGWALGSGNSFPDYVPVRNYIAMLDEGRKYAGYR